VFPIEVKNLDDTDSYGGESLFALITNRFGGNGLYTLDEPEAAITATRNAGAHARTDRRELAVHYCYPVADLNGLSGCGYLSN
jgi:hypothetical protein